MTFGLKNSPTTILSLINIALPYPELFDYYEVYAFYGTSTLMKRTAKVSPLPFSESNFVDF
ncbi:hypothetical protein QNH20_10500 [Neobacillus sp. WH10]|uniref:hypothetical protein n=1 Tax=Neobacillus sp. WH10 TaxID=3047873 RepID=UPI0024C1635D|nr:hypothetical protein [Neobacillus sp. WH10]WHY79533.1 hypothetical protein QNH20_10500 [Neobacillus sp. WH10]